MKTPYMDSAGRVGLLGAMLLAALGCSRQEVMSPVEVAETPTPGVAAPSTELSLRDYMVHVMQHNALELWDWTSHEIDEAGYTVIAPKNDEEWEEAESAALTIVELTAPLYAPPLGREDAEWTARLDLLRNVANQAAEAALEQDYEAFMSASDKMDVACVSCHYIFAPQIEDPALKDFYLNQQ